MNEKGQPPVQFRRSPTVQAGFGDAGGLGLTCAQGLKKRGLSVEHILDIGSLGANQSLKFALVCFPKFTHRVIANLVHLH